MLTGVSVEQRKIVYMDLYNKTCRSSSFNIKEINRAMTYYNNCPDAIKDYSKMLALNEVFSQLKFVLSRLDRSDNISKMVSGNAMSNSVSRVIIESTKQVKQLQNILNILDAEVDILSLVLEVDG